MEQLFKPTFFSHFYEIEDVLPASEQKDVGGWMTSLYFQCLVFTLEQQSMSGGASCASLFIG